MRFYVRDRGYGMIPDEIDWWGTFGMYLFLFVLIGMIAGGIQAIRRSDDRIACREQGMVLMFIHPWSSTGTCVPPLPYPVRVEGELP